MSLSKQAAVTKMESLPADAIEALCRYLSEQEIVICSMVSRSWREIFNDDIIWKPLCCPRLQLEERLRTMPCAVEPSFDSTVTPDSTLSTISQWKIANMREKRLWNNIRKGNCKETPINHDKNKGFPSACGFLTDDLVFLIFADSIEVWDIRLDPAVKVSERAHSFTSNEITSFTVVGEDKEMTIAVDGFRVRLFNIDFQAGSIVESSVFYFDAIEEVKSLRRNYNNDDVPKYVCSGSFFLGVNRGRSNLLHVWDLKHGRKITEHSVDMPEFHIIDIYGSQTTSNVLVVVAPEKQDFIKNPNPNSILHAEDGQFFYMVYCTEENNFLAFKDVSPSSNGYSCALLKHFVAILDKHSLRIFNYKTSEQIFYLGIGFHLGTDKIVTVGDFFLCLGITIFNELNITEPFIGTQDLTNNITILFKQNPFVEIIVLDELHQLGKSCVYFSETNITFQFKNHYLEKIEVMNYKGMNSSCTRYLACNQHVGQLEEMLAQLSARLSDFQENPIKMEPKVPKEKARKLIIVKQCW